MAAAPQQQLLDELMKAAEGHHEQYLRSLRTLHETLGHKKRERADSLNTINESFLPVSGALSGPVFSSDSLSSQAGAHLHRRLTRPPTYYSPKPLIPSMLANGYSDCAVADDDLNFIPLLDPTGSAVPGHTERPSSTNNESSTPPAPRSIPPGYETPRTTEPLLPMRFTDDMLLRHLRDSEFWGETADLLADALRRRGDIDLSQPFRDFASYEREGYTSANFEVYDVAADASAKKISMDVDVQGVVKYAGDGPYESPEEVVDAPMVWESIKEVNTDGQTVGRITIVQEPTPLILAALHLTMSPHFDMSEILHHLLSDAPNRGRSHACMHRAFEKDIDTTLAPMPLTPGVSFSRLRQRSFFFVFKYYTVLGDGLEPAPWQRYDRRDLPERLGDHIDIAECGSVLALSLGGEPTKPVRIRPRRERVKEGYLFDTFGPWQLLSIQSFPDDLHTVRSDDFTQKSFYNGPYAFLDLLVAEYRDAAKRNLILHERITKLITPPTEFMFDRRLRDKLLFEDKHFTYIRRYFWAYNTLAVVNTGIKAMVAAYVDTFTEDFWAGTHPLVWPCPSELSAEAAEAYRDKMALLRRELDKVVSELDDVQKRNERTRKEIENLRDQLFSGSSIKESRRAIDQGDNIRILTMISMLFLPLTFVTSVFGITELHIPATDWRFAVTMVAVCIPFMILVFLLQTRLFTRMLRKMGDWLLFLVSLPGTLMHSLRDASDAAHDSRSTAHVAQPMRRKRRVIMVEETRKRWRWPWENPKAADDEKEAGQV